MANGFFQDSDGDKSNSRLGFYIIIFGIFSLAYISVFTGRDIGSNVSNLLTIFGSTAAGACKIKDAVEWYSTKKIKKEEKNDNIDKPAN